MELFGIAPALWLPVAFAVLMGVSIALYVILDGYDLGVGILMAAATPAEKDRMVASIGPFWDANQTWLVLGIGLLLVAFPRAHEIVLGALYLPVFVLLLGLVLRGVAFEFRAKVDPVNKGWWNATFIAGSLLAALSQGYMLGLYIMGFERTLPHIAFAALVGICLAAAYAFIGATWLILKTDGTLQIRAIAWARRTLWLAGLGMVLVSVVTPLISERIFTKWFSLPTFFALAPIPVITGALFVGLFVILNRMPFSNDRHAWVPFAGAIGIFLLGFHGLAYSFYPFVVPDRLTIWEAASAPESLFIIFVGAIFVLPVILGYSVVAYWIFKGKATDLKYY